VDLKIESMKVRDGGTRAGSFFYIENPREGLVSETTPWFFLRYNFD
jgi:hypothetical protein